MSSSVKSAPDAAKCIQSTLELFEKVNENAGKVIFDEEDKSFLMNVLVNKQKQTILNLREIMSTRAKVLSGLDDLMNLDPEILNHFTRKQATLIQLEQSLQKLATK